MVRPSPCHAILCGLLLALAACGNEVDSATGSSESDLYEKGTTQSRFADPAKAYLPRRSLSLLKGLGALGAARLAVATRVDGIIANKPADGWVSIDELVRAEAADKWPAFLDAEQAEFPAIWSLFEAPDAVASEMPSVDAPGSIDRTTHAGPPTPPVLHWTELPAALHVVAQRLERLHDEDADPSTVSVADAAAGIAQPDAFTQAEVAELAQIRDFLLDHAVNAPGHAILEVPMPGASDVVLFADLGASIRLHRETKVAGRRAGATYPIGSRQPSDKPILTSLSLLVDDKITVAPPAGQVLAIVRADGSTLLYDAPRTLGPYDQDWSADDQVVVETWSGGKRTGGCRARFRAVQAAPKRDLSEYFDYEIVLADGTPLVQNVTASWKGFGGVDGAYYEFVYETAARAYPGVDASVVTKLATPKFKLPPARYRTAYGSESVEFEVFASGAATVQWKTSSFTHPVQRMKLATNFNESFWVVLPEPAYGSPGYYPERPYLFPGGQVYLQTGFPVLTPKNRF